MNKRKVLAICCISFMASASLAAQSVNRSLYKKAKAYFAGQTAPAKVIPTKNITKDSLSVWTAWKEHVALTSDGKLPDLQPLTDKANHSWTLPDSLEPNATLNFYYGTKGDTDGQRPLFLYLHGSGPRAMEWAAGLQMGQMFNDAPSAYFIPQIPQEGNWYRWYQKSKQWFVESLFRQALASGQIDPYRLYLFGISEGGYGSQRLASFYADYLAAAGPMAGGEPLKNAPAENCGNIAFSLMTGEKDYGFYRNMLTTYTNLALDSLQAAYPGEYTHNIELVEGMGHGFDYRVMTPWLKQFKRNPTPKHFIWEDYEMDNRHRTGFYNLLVNQRPSGDKRTRYEFTAKGNTIDITMQDVDYTCTQKDPQWGIELCFNKTYSLSTGGNITVFLSDALVDTNSEVTIRINGKEAYKGTPQKTATAMLRSTEAFGDPLRIFPVAIDLDLSAVQ